MPYFTHSITAKGRQCGDCHQNEVVQKMMKSEAANMMACEDGEIKRLEGVVPMRPEQLDWVFLKRINGGWATVPDGEPPAIQFAVHGEPLNDVQFDSLAMDFSW